MTDVVIDELIPPDSLVGPGGDEFRELIEMRNLVETDTLGTDALAATPESIFPHFTSSSQKSRRHFVVRDGGRIIARGLMGWLTAENAPAVSIMADVLPSHRRRGIGSALFAYQERLAADLGRHVLQAEAIHTSSVGGERVVPSTGFGDVPANDPGVQFLLHHGYRLEQVARISSLDLTNTAASLEEHRRAAQEKAGADYRIVHWSGRTPEKWLEQKAALSTAMSVDEPSGGLEVIADVWDADRVREHDDRQEGSGRIIYTSAAEHVPTGTLVAHTELGRLEGDNQPAVQEDTLVLRAHRGHRLGMLLKAVNAQKMLEQAPDTPQITTFNVEENEPMLRVNIDLGFRPIGAEGVWQKRV
ncbi:GNAT superfamily N-acetyltransferase [Aeromicrobium panaciterrae]|uniref:GNAT superfamily N-acetyltransferase n=1 Tax=Aeromicrobium panaciterrae TaxID=363861 RepID=A0ABU1UJQ5_9ACTN|nr:GNAT family N-acetyltransferase [Aeromicrobium panaciterrae]MDR7085411.1 GNAT superfamily N-acetyltransferase [Aeromicrobium panaciterrae]